MIKTELGRQYILMHKDIPVVEFALDTVSGAVLSIGKIYEIRYIPVGIPVCGGAVSEK